jgi:phosphatidylglycerol lysyltransferase
VLFFCFPFVHGADYPHVLAVFIVALTAGFISHVPGGLGVFDTIVLVGLQDRVPGDAVLAGLLVFRVVYFLIPLLAAGALFGTVEAMAARRRLQRVSQSLGAWLAPGVPLVLAGCTFVAGAVLLFSIATPEAHYKLRLLYRVLPLSVVESAHFVGSVVGVLLVLVAARLQRRSHGAWVVAMVLLAAGAVASLLKGLDWPQALLLGLFFLVMWVSRDEFYRRSALVAERFTPGWFLAIGVVLGSAFWLGLFSYKHLDDANQLWWRFALFGDASRFIRASVVVAVIALAEAVRRLMGTARLQSTLPSPRGLARAAEIVEQSPDARANLALLGDKALLFHAKEDAFLMYGVRRRSWIVLGDPVGPRERWRDLVRALAEEAVRHGGWPVFYGISPDAARICSEFGFAVRKIGEEAVVRLDAFDPAALDAALARRHADIAAAGCRYEVLEPVELVPLAPRLKAVADEWLASHGRKERAFAQGAFAPELLQQSRVGIVRQGDRMLAFAVLWESACRVELSVDLVRHAATAPAGILDFVLVETMLWGKARGFASFNLGLAPLKGLDRRRARSRWERLGTYLYGHGEHFRDFLELRRAKARYHPRWEPRFVSSRQGLPLARALPDLVQLIAEAPRSFAAP